LRIVYLGKILMMGKSDILIYQLEDGETEI